jgi:hypothetical protein
MWAKVESDAKIPQLEKNNFGASFGGPIRRDKTFFYAVYEGLFITIHEEIGTEICSKTDRARAQNCHIFK